MTLIRALALLLLLTISTVPASADPLPLAPGELVRGDFVQERHLKGFANPLVSQGQFVLVPGQGLIWSVVSPFPVTTAVTPAGLLQTAAGSESLRLPASRMPGMAQLYQMLDGALSGNFAAVEQIFTVTRDGGRVTLLPRRTGNAEAMPLESLTLETSEFVDAVEIRKGNGDFDRIRFLNQQRSAGNLDPAEAVMLRSAGGR